MEKVSVVIPVYNHWDLVKYNVNSLLKFDKENIEEIIIVNDHSSEQRLFEFDYDLVKVINNEENLGYTGTVNRGLKCAKSSIVILLDSDAFLIEPVINRIVKLFDQNPLLGCIGFKTVNKYGKQTGSYQYEPTVFGLIIGQQMEAKFEKLPFRRKSRILPYSCTVSFRKKCLDEVEYFDQETFPILEADNDLSMRIHQSSWELALSNNIILGHEGGNSYTVNSRRVNLFYQSRWKLLRKHGKVSNPFLVKNFFLLRVLIESVILHILILIKPDKLGICEKIVGRKSLAKQFSSCT